MSPVAGIRPDDPALTTFGAAGRADHGFEHALLDLHALVVADLSAGRALATRWASRLAGLYQGGDAA